MPDATDRRILRQLLADPGIANADLAERAGVTPASLWRRLERMRETGVIRSRLDLPGEFLMPHQCVDADDFFVTTTLCR